MRNRSAAGALIALVTTFWPTGDAFSQEAIEPTIHWAYSSFFGTGWYKVSDERSAFILRAAPRWTFGEAGFDESGNRNIAYTLRVPVTLGITRLDFEDLPAILDPGNLATASLNFSVDADIPMTERFSMRPSAEIGHGTVLGENDSAWTYKVEVKTRYTFQSGRFDWGLLFDVGSVGYEPKKGESDDFTFAAVGAEFDHPVGWFSGEDSQTMLYWHVAYTDFIDEIEFNTGIEEIDSVANYWQLGAALGKRDKPVRISFLSFDRLGLAFRFSTTSELRGVKFLFRSLYEL